MLRVNFTHEGKQFVLVFPTAKFNYDYKGKRGFLSVFYVPDNCYVEGHVAEQVLEDYSDVFFEEIFKVVSEHTEFYEQFKIDRRFIRGGWSGGYNYLGQKAANYAWRTLSIELKE